MHRLSRNNPLHPAFPHPQRVEESPYRRPSWSVVFGLLLFALLVGFGGGLELDAAKLEQARAEVRRAQAIWTRIATEYRTAQPAP